MTVEVGAAAVRGEQRCEHGRVGEHEHPAGVEQDGVEAQVAHVGERPVTPGTARPPSQPPGRGQRSRCRTSRSTASIAAMSLGSKSEMLSRRHCPCSARGRSLGRRAARGAGRPSRCRMNDSTQAAPVSPLPPCTVVVRSGVAGGGVEGDDRVEDLQRTHATRDEHGLGRRVVGRRQRLASATTQSTVVSSRPRSASTAAGRGWHRAPTGGGDTSVGRRRLTGQSGRRRASSPICSNWSVEIPHCVIRSISAVRSFMSTPPTLATRQSPCSGVKPMSAKMSSPGERRRRRRRGRGARVGGVGRSTGKAGKGEGGDGRGDQGSAHAANS